MVGCALERSVALLYHTCLSRIMEDRLAVRKGNPGAARARAADALGDDIGAAELGRRVAENLRQRRKARGMSLDDLAQSSGVSRAALSQIETQKSNPTLGILWKIAVGLGVPFADLIGEAKGGVSILRRGDAQILRSLDGKLESRPLAPAGASPVVELYELRLAARSTHASEAHAARHPRAGGGAHRLLAAEGGERDIQSDRW